MAIFKITVRMTDKAIETTIEIRQPSLETLILDVGSSP
jgi:hypothetical protein